MSKMFVFVYIPVSLITAVLMGHDLNYVPKLGTLSSASRQTLVRKWGCWDRQVTTEHIS